MTDKTYNGWTNYETWLTNLHFDGSFDLSDEVEEGYFDGMNRNQVKSWIANYIEECVEEYAYGDIELGTPNRLFITDMIQSFLQEVDWDDIAEQYLDDVMKAQQERLENA